MQDIGKGRQEEVLELLSIKTQLLCVSEFFAMSLWVIVM